MANESAAPCTCTGLRHCSKCFHTRRVAQQLDAAAAHGVEEVKHVFELQSQDYPQSSCSFASLPSKSPYYMCSGCGGIFALLPAEEASDDCTRHATRERQTAVSLDGLFFFPDTMQPSEEQVIVDFLDGLGEVRGFPGWKVSQSGRRKQDFGPQANFKKRRLKMRSDVPGMPLEFQTLFTRISDIVTQRTASSCEGSKDDCGRFHIVEASALDYDPLVASNLDPHVDDTWIWGPRVAGISFLHGCVMTFVSQAGEQVDVWLPRRWAFVLTGASRFSWLHGIRGSGLVGRRISVTMRELNPSAVLPEETRSAIADFAQRFV